MERRAIAASRHVFFLSEEDRAVLSQNGMSASVLALRLPDAARKHAMPLQHDVGLIGTWTWRPNLIGLTWFLEEVVPLLPATIKIAVAGRLPPALSSPSPNVQFLGMVADAADFVQSCRLMALSSRIGTGVQLKTIELMQLGWPAVATSSSLRGIAHRPENLFVADDPRAFAAAIVQKVANGDAGIQPADGQIFAGAQGKVMHAAITNGLAVLAKQQSDSNSTR
jgi:glycosyltransferase involved in cell wall biosynthesis